MSGRTLLLFLLLALPAAAQDAPWDRLPFEDGFVQVLAEGRIGRFLYDPDWKKEYEVRKALADLNTAAPSVWKTKIFILKKIDADWKDQAGNARHSVVEFDDERVATFRRVAEAFVDWVRVYSTGSARLDAEIVVLEDPLTKLDEWGDCVHPWAGAIDPLVAPHVEPGAVDSVLVYWPGGDLPHRNYWGLTSWGICRGAGYSWVVDLGGTIDERAYAEVSLHEWLHQMEAVRSGIMGYTGMPALHDSGRMGYRGDEHHPGWMMYYRDFMVPYMTPAMWRRGNPREAAAGRPRAGFEGGFVTEWLVAGPFDNADDHGLDREVPGEGAALPAESEAFGTAAWRKVSCAGHLDLDATLSPNEQVVGYAHVYVKSPRRRKAFAWVGSDDGVVVRMNGREVGRNHVHRGCAPDQDRYEVLLKAGWNRFLFKVDEGNGAFGLMARFSNPDGTPIGDLEFRADRPEDPIGVDDEPVPADSAWRHSYHDWRLVRDDPWRLLPELGEAELRWITRDLGLRLATGDHYTALLPSAPRVNAIFAATPTAGTYRVDNTLDVTSESLAWLRFERAGLARDLVLLRGDVAAFWLERLDALDDPSVEVVGKVTAGGRPMIAVETRLRHPADGEPPPTELHLLAARDGVLAASLRPEWRTAARGEKIRCRARIANLRGETVPVAAIALAGVGNLSGAFDLPPFAEWEAAFEVDPGPGEPGVLPIVLAVTSRREGVERRLSVPAVVAVQKPFELLLLDGATGRSGRPLPMRARLANQRHRPISVRLRHEVPAGWKLAGEPPAALEIPALGTVDLALPLEGPAPGPDEVALFRVVAEVEGDLPVVAEARWKRSPWHLAGPFANAEGKGFETAHPPEGAVFDGWFDLVPADATATSTEVDHRAIFDPRDWQVAYAAADLVVAEAVKATLRFGSDDTLTVWIDGTQVIAKNVYRGAAPGQDVLEVDLAPGRHRLVVKVCQGGGGWKFFFDTPTPGVTLEPPAD